MNEYHDQATWFEVRIKHHGHWIVMDEFSTREEAEESLFEEEREAPHHEFRIFKVRGLDV